MQGTAVSSTPQFGRSGRHAEESSPGRVADGGGGAFAMPGRSLQDAFAEILASTGQGQEGREEREGVAGAQQGGAAQQIHGKICSKPSPSMGRCAAPKEALSSRAQGSRASQESKLRRGSSSNLSAGAVSGVQRRRSAQRCGEVGATAGGGDASVQRLQQEVVAKDQEIGRLRAMCSRLQDCQWQSSADMEVLKRRMGEFEHLLQAQGGSTGGSTRGSKGAGSGDPP
ncbi:unnamed protein product, partial [Polarella glacialis]